jgi:hypothetical protein
LVTATVLEDELAIHASAAVSIIERFSMSAPLKHTIAQDYMQTLKPYKL